MATSYVKGVYKHPKETATPCWHVVTSDTTQLNQKAYETACGIGVTGVKTAARSDGNPVCPECLNPPKADILDQRERARNRSNR